MDSTATSSRRHRVDTRSYRRTQSTRLDEEKRVYPNRREGQPRGDSKLPSTEEEDRQPAAMTKDHRFYHRRQAASPTKVLTVAVEVIATVDSRGSLVGQETKTAAVDAPRDSSPSDAAVVPAAVSAADSAAAPVVPAAINAADALASPAAAAPSLPQVPSVPAMPTVALPVVPSVPPFPSDLTVPPYPFASPSSAALAAAISSVPATPSPAPTSVPGSSIVPSSILASLNQFSNSTMSVSSRSSTASVSGRSASASSSVSDDQFTVAAFTRTSSSSDSDETTSSQFTSATSSPSSDDPTYYAGGGAFGTANPGAGPSQTAGAVGASATGTTPALQTPQVVGSVVGSLAGAAFVLAIILLLLQRHKRRRQGALQLTNEETTERAPPMSHNDSNANRIPSAFLNRFSGMSRSTVDTSTSAGERSFQRVSGRKLPSAFSEGMTSDQFSRGGTMSGSSFYTDDQGTYGGPGFGKEFGKEIGGAAAAGGAMNIREGPRRTPIIRHPDDDANPFADPAPFPRTNSHLSPPQSPNADAPKRGTLGRSLYSHDGSRSSKFTENV